jgi:hypothetical protein
MKITANRQEPFVYGSLGGGVISLVPPPSQPQEPLASNVKADYDLVSQIGTRKAWEIFLNTYKTGFYAELAAAQLAKLMEVAKLEPPAPPTPSPALPSSDEQRAWDRIRDSGDQAALQDFIKRYPRSPLVLNAQKRLETLQQIAREREEKAQEERRAKAAEAERQKAEQQAALQAKAAEAERQKAEQQAAFQAKAAEAERQKAEQAKAEQAKAEQRAWDKIKESIDQVALQDFINRYPSSPLVVTAQKRLETAQQIAREQVEKARAEREAAQQKAEQQKAAPPEAEQRKVAVPTAPTDDHATPGPNPNSVAALEAPPAPSSAKPSSAETRAWDRIKESDNQAALQEFIKRYSTSPLVLNAQKRLETLQQIAREREEKAQEERRVKAAEAERQKAEQQAALQAKTAEAERQKAEQQAALQAKAAEAERQKAERPTVPVVVSNTSELIHAAQIELSRLGCFSGKADGTLNAATKSGINRYLSRRGSPDPDVAVTESFISELRDQQLRNCQLVCPSGQTADGDTCVASKKSAQPTKSARQHDDVQDKPKANRQATKQEAKQDKRSDRPSAQSQPQVRQEVSTAPRESHGGGSMIGVGF